jgi:hypothetical protein
MSIETNLNVTPFFNDYDKDKQYYKILFRPGVSVQARELTQIQDILQNQVESFGDHVFKSGTIVSGVNFQFYPAYNYVKIIDTQVDGQPVVPAAYQNLYAKNSNNLEAKIVNYKTGFQATDPNMNYLYLKYINAGTSGTDKAFSNADVLTIYNKTFELFDFVVVNGGTGFSNSDSVEIVSTLLVNNQVISTGNIVQVNGANTANVEVIEANTTFSVTIDGVDYSGSDGYTLLKIKPHNADLANTTLTSSRWSIQPGAFVTQGANNAYVTAVIGAGATAVLTTDSSGVVADVSLVTGGFGYHFAPYVTVRTSSGALTNLDITPQTFKAQVTVADSSYTGGGANPVGNAYAFGVTEGTIYQKGYFLKVDPQTIIVNAYSSNVDSVSVGFTTTETIVNTNVDSTLLDNATGSYNFAAPGAHRLKLTPTLAVISQSNVVSNNSFFTLVDFRDGQPYKQNRNTSYNVLLKEFERRTDDTNGSFVVDPFDIATKDQTTWSNTNFNVVVDPGIAYIKGKRLQTEKNTFVPIARARTTKANLGQFKTLSYGSYVEVQEYAGFFNTQTADTIDLYNTARKFYTSNQTSITTTGRKIGTARIRSVIHESGTPGTPTASYRVYLFDINMNAGSSFSDVRTLYYDGPSSSDNGIADVILELDPTTDKEIAILKDTSQSTLVYDIGVKGVSNVAGGSYVYRTSNSTANISTLGILTLTISDTLPFGNSVVLSTPQKSTLIVTPLANATSTNTVTAAVATRNQSYITGTGLSTYFRAGDFVYLQDGSSASSNTFAKVQSVANSTYMTLDKPWPFTTTSNTTIARHLRAFYPIPLDDDRVRANTDSLGQTLTIDFGNASNTVTLSSLVPVTIIYDAKKSDTAIEKTVQRNALVKISIADNPGGIRGPWSLGIPDVFRLNKVYIGNSSVNTSSLVATSSFYVDSGQTDDYYGLAQLYRHQTGRPLGPDEYLLVDVDCFTLASPTATGYFTVNSYKLTQNNTPRTSLSNNFINILEIPVFKSANGNVLSLENSIDFRPRAVATANITSTLAGATVNPSSTLTFGSHSKNFPYPDYAFEYDYTYYLPRKDRVVLDMEGNISVIRGTPAAQPVPPPETVDQITLGIINVPMYPSLPQVMDKNQIDFLTTRLATGTNAPSKQLDYQVTDTITSTQYRELPRRYTMADIGRLERRINNLEYYTSLNLLEKQTSELVIPSSLNPLLNRFKHGFFVEKFEDYLQIEISAPDSTAVIDQSRSFLQPLSRSLNLQSRFNYANAATLSSLHSEEDFIEPGFGKWGEAVLTLPTNGTYDLVNQGRFTSAISGVGGDVKFIGEMITRPSSFKVTFKGELKITDTYDYATSANSDVWANILTNTSPAYVLSSDKIEIVEGQSANITLQAINVANGTVVGYTITGISSGDINVSSTGTMTLIGNTERTVATLSIAANSDASPEGTETLSFSVNVGGVNSISLRILDDGLNPRGVLTCNTENVLEGQTALFTLDTDNVNTGVVIPYTLSGVGITASDLNVPLTGNLTINSTGFATLSVTPNVDFVSEGSNGVETLSLTVHHPLNLTKTIFVTDLPKPIFSLVANTNIINEGQSVRFTLSSLSNVANTTFPYVITGVNSSGDIDVPLRGTLTYANNSANLVVTTNSTMVTAGSPTMRFEVDLTSQDVANLTQSVAIIDQTPTKLLLTANTDSIAEGQSVKFTLEANGWNGNVFSYTITGISSGDIDPTPLTGNLTIVSNSANLVVTANNDGSPENNETMLLTVRDASNTRTLSRAVVITGNTIVNSFSLSSDRDFVDEGNTVIFTLQTTGIGNASYQYDISGTNITASDFTTPRSGRVSLVGNTTLAVANVSVTLAKNVDDFAAEQFTFAVGDGFNRSRTVTINPSAAPDPTIEMDKTLINLKLAADQRTVTFTILIPGYTGTANYVMLNGKDAVAGTSTGYTPSAEVQSTGIGKTGSNMGDAKNVSNADREGTLTFTGGVATKTIVFVGDNYNNLENYRMRIMLPAGYALASGQRWTDSKRVIFAQNASLGTWKVDVPTFVGAGNTFAITINTYKSFSGAQFNYNITGVTSDDLNGASLTGVIDTFTVTGNTTASDGTGSSQTFTVNSSLSSAKNIVVNIGSAVPGALTPNTAVAEMMISPSAITMPTYAGRISLSQETSTQGVGTGTILGIVPKVVTTRLYTVDINTVNVPNKTVLTYTVDVFRGTKKIDSAASQKATITANSFTSAPRSYNSNTTTTAGVFTTTIQSEIFGVQPGDVFHLTVRNGTAIVAQSNTVVPANFVTTPDVKIGY